MYNNKSLLLIELGSLSKLWMVERILSLGVDLYVAQKEKLQELEDVLSPEKIIYVDTYSVNDLLPSIINFIERENINFSGIGTFFEHAVPNVAIVAQVLGLPSLDVSVAYSTSNCKAVMRHILARANLDDVSYKIISSLPEDLYELCSDAPCVLKPVVGNNSYGVVFLSEKQDAQVKTFITKTTGRDTELIFEKGTDIFLLEEYLDGTQMTVDGYVFKGDINIFGMTEVLYSPPPYFVQHTNFIPPREKDSVIKKCSVFVNKIVSELGIDNSFFHCELKIHNEKPRLIEIAGRLAGGRIVEGYEKAYGYDLIMACVDLWFGISPNIKKVRNIYVAQSGVFVDQCGTVLNIRESLAGDYVWSYEIVTQVGEENITFPDYPKPIVFFAISAENSDVLQQRYEDTLKNLEIKISCK